MVEFTLLYLIFGFDLTSGLVGFCCWFGLVCLLLVWDITVVGVWFGVVAVICGMLYLRFLELFVVLVVVVGFVSGSFCWFGGVVLLSECFVGLVV